MWLHLVWIYAYEGLLFSIFDHVSRITFLAARGYYCVLCILCAVQLFSLQIEKAFSVREGRHAAKSNKFVPHKSSCRAKQSPLSVCEARTPHVPVHWFMLATIAKQVWVLRATNLIALSSLPCQRSPTQTYSTVWCLLLLRKRQYKTQLRDWCRKHTPQPQSIQLS